jgi:hypothetical protein
MSMSDMEHPDEPRSYDHHLPPQEPTESPFPWEDDGEIAARRLGITESEKMPPGYDPNDESTFPKFPSPAVQAERNAIFRTLMTEFNANFYWEDLPEDEPEIVACFLMNYFDGDGEKLDELIGHLETRLETGARD